MSDREASFKLYRVTNRVTNETQQIGAESAQEACQLLGWLVGDCHIKVVLDPADLVPRPIRSQN